jgi:hypothetical protein
MRNPKSPMPIKQNMVRLNTIRGPALKHFESPGIPNSEVTALVMNRGLSGVDYRAICANGSMAIKREAIVSIDVAFTRASPMHQPSTRTKPHRNHATISKLIKTVWASIKFHAFKDLASLCLPVGVDKPKIVVTILSRATP